jgi:hypothetical protein
MPGKDVWGWAGHWARHAGAARKNGRRMTPLQSTSLARALALWVALTLGWLEWPWLAVPVVSIGLVAAQSVLLAKGADVDA